MRTTAHFHDVVIIGAGASGLWSAIELAPDHNVLVVEAGDVGAGASGAAAGFVSAFADWAHVPAALTYSWEQFRALDGQYDFTFHNRPYVEFVASAEEAAALQTTYQPLFEHSDYDIDYYTANELANRWSDRIDVSSFHGALVKEDSGIIDASAYVDTLARVARDRGVEIRTQTPIEQIHTVDGAVTGVETPVGQISAETVVCTAGAQTDTLVAPFVDLPTRQFVYMNLCVKAETALPSDYPMCYARDVWWRPDLQTRDRFLVSGGMYFLQTRDQPPRRPPREYLQEVKRVFESLVYDVDQVRVVPESYQTCSKGSSITPDALPIIDAPAAAPDGLVLATGVTAGISMSPFTGRAVRALLTGEDALISLAPFVLDRFDAPPADFQVHEIRTLPSESASDQ